MLATVAAIGGGLFVLASLVVGGRVALLSFKTKGLPEFLLGTGLFFMGGVGYPLMQVAIVSTNLPDETRTAMMIWQMTFMVAGMSGVAWFTRRVFRPRETWAGALLLAITATYVGLALAQGLGPGLIAFLNDPESGPWAQTGILGAVPMTWAGVESFRYYRMQKKRLAIGLADPVVTDRFRLWAVAILSADAITVAAAVLKGFGVGMATTPIGAMLVGSLGLVTSAALWFAFVPPASYVQRVAARAAKSSAN